MQNFMLLEEIFIHRDLFWSLEYGLNMKILHMNFFNFKKRRDFEFLFSNNILLILKDL